MTHPRKTSLVSTKDLKESIAVWVQFLLQKFIDFEEDNYQENMSVQ